MKALQLHLLKFAVGAAIWFCAAADARAAENLRYLFLIEHSPEMASRQIATAQTVHDIIRSGFEGEIKDGEKFALYFYGSRLQTTRPFVWRKGYELALARQAANLFSGRIFSKLRPPPETLFDAAAHVEVSPEITVFYFTDGNQPITGTPFDDKLNEAIARRRSVFLRADKPFVVTFVARNQTLVDGRVHTEANAPFLIPETDREDETMAKALAAVRTAAATPPSDPTDKARATLRDALVAKTNTPIPVDSLKFSPVLKEPPPVEAKAEPPLVLAPAPVEKKETPPPVVEPTPKPAEVAVINPAPIEPGPEPKPTIREEPKPQPAPPPAPKPEPVVVETKPIIKEEPKPAIKEDPKPQVVEKPVTSVVVARQEVPLTSAPPVQAATVAPHRKSFPWPALLGGLVAIMIGGGIAVVRAKQRAKSPGSIITQALPDIHRKPPQ